MTLAQDTHKRRSLRLRDYDYSSSGAYFLTICTHDRECWFGEIEDGEIRLNRFGRIVSEEWLRSADLRAEIVLDNFVVMPNHLHGIVFLDPVGVHGLPNAGAYGNESPVGAHGRAPLQRPKRSLGSFVAGFKSVVTKRINEIRGTPGKPVWQRNYVEHIIRSQCSLERIRHYILCNPHNWQVDRENRPSGPCCDDR